MCLNCCLGFVFLPAPGLPGSGWSFWSILFSCVPISNRLDRLRSFSHRSVLAERAGEAVSAGGWWCAWENVEKSPAAHHVPVSVFRVARCWKTIEYTFSKTIPRQHTLNETGWDINPGCCATVRVNVRYAVRRDECFYPGVLSAVFAYDMPARFGWATVHPRHGECDPCILPQSCRQWPFARR